MKRKYPMLWPTAALIGGLIVAGVPGGGYLLFSIVASFAACLWPVTFFFPRNGLPLRYIALCAALFALAGFHFLSPHPDDVPLPEGRHIVCRLTRIAPWQGSGARRYALCKADAWQDSSGCHRAQALVQAWFPAAVVEAEGANPMPRRFLCRLTPLSPPPAALPELFDYKSYLAAKHCHAIAWPDTACIRTLPPHYAAQPHAKLRHFLSLWDPLLWREQIQAHLYRHFPDSTTATLISGLCLADKNGMNAYTKQAFRKSGAGHLLAVSGLHIGLLYAGLRGLLYLLLLLPWGRIVREICILGALWAYLTVIAFPPSATRAVLLITLYGMGSLIQRPLPPLNALLTCAFVSLWKNPHLLGDVSFQLSYAAVAALILLAPQIKKTRIFRAMTGTRAGQTRAGTYLLNCISLSLAVCLGTLPIILRHFQSLPLLSPFSNLILIPLCSLILLVFLCRLPFLPFPRLLFLANALLHFLSDLLIKLTASLAAIPHATLDAWISVPQAILLALAVASYCAALALPPSTKALYPYRWIPVYACLIAFCAVGTRQAVHNRHRSALYKPLLSRGNVILAETSGRLYVLADSTALGTIRRTSWDAWGRSIGKAQKTWIWLPPVPGPLPPSRRPTP